jgi:micrococcal nuclease
MHARCRRRSAARVALARSSLVLLAGLAVAAGLAACARPGTDRLVTTPAERASWPRPPSGTVTVRVERVVDGDTFEVAVAGRREAVRLIGVDTPETVAPGRPVERYGPQASAFAKHWLGGRTVRLAGDAEPRDRYGRLLAYAWLADGTFWNALLLAEGYAETLTIAPNDSFAALFDRLATAARSAHRGLWANAATAHVTAASWHEGKKQRPAVRGDPGSPPTTGPLAGRQGRRNANLLPAPPVSSRPRR